MQGQSKNNRYIEQHSTFGWADLKTEVNHGGNSASFSTTCLSHFRFPIFPKHCQSKVPLFLQSQLSEGTKALLFDFCVHAGKKMETLWNITYTKCHSMDLSCRKNRNQRLGMEHGEVAKVCQSDYILNRSLSSWSVTKNKHWFLPQQPALADLLVSPRSYKNRKGMKRLAGWP